MAFDDIINSALWAAYERGKDRVGLSPGVHHQIIKDLDKAGFQITAKNVGPTLNDAGENRWEVGIRNIVHHLHGPSYAFDIPDIVEEVRALRDKVAADRSKPEPTELYRNAMALLRGGHPLAEAVAIALGDASPDGPEGNVWKHFDARMRTRATPTAATEGTVAILTPEGERVIEAVALGDYSAVSMPQLASVFRLKDRLATADFGADISKLIIGYASRPLTDADYAGMLKLEPGTVDEPLAPGVTLTMPDGERVTGTGVVDLVSHLTDAYLADGEPTGGLPGFQGWVDRARAQGKVIEVPVAGRPGAGTMVDIGEPTGRSYVVTTVDDAGREHHVVHREYMKRAG